MSVQHTKIEKIEELLRSTAHPKSENKIIVLVEGEDDYRLFNKFFNNSTCIIDFIPGGKSSLEEGLARLLTIHRLTIGIEDADFAHLENTPTTIRNLFLTDYHDMEMQMASTTELFSALLHEFYPAINPNQHSRIFQQLLQSIRFTAYLRYVNYLNNWELNFKGISFTKAFDNQQITFENDYILDLILLQSPNAKEKDKSNIKTAIEETESPNHDMLQLCNGHDLVKIIGLFLGINDKNVAQKLRTSYRLSDFQQTQLYQSLLIWANNKKTAIF